MRRPPARSEVGCNRRDGRDGVHNSQLCPCLGAMFNLTDKTLLMRCC